MTVSTNEPRQDGEKSGARSGPWAPFRSRAFARMLEQFVVGSWDEHLRQHERVSRRDERRLKEIDEMTDPSQPSTVTHWLAPHPQNKAT